MVRGPLQQSIVTRAGQSVALCVLTGSLANGRRDGHSITDVKGYDAASEHLRLLLDRRRAGAFVPNCATPVSPVLAHSGTVQIAVW